MTPNGPSTARVSLVYPRLELGAVGGSSLTAVVLDHGVFGLRTWSFFAPKAGSELVSRGPVVVSEQLKFLATSPIAGAALGRPLARPFSNADNESFVRWSTAGSLPNYACR